MALVHLDTANDAVPLIIEDETDFPWQETVRLVDGEVRVVSERDDWREATDAEYGRYIEHYLAEEATP